MKSDPVAALGPALVEIDPTVEIQMAVDYLNAVIRRGQVRGFATKLDMSRGGVERLCRVRESDEDLDDHEVGR